MGGSAIDSYDLGLTTEPLFSSYPSGFLEGKDITYGRILQINSYRCVIIVCCVSIV